MKNTFLKNLTLFVLAIFSISCKRKEPNELNNGIELVKNNSAINDTLRNYKQKLGVDFMLCYIITRDNYRRIGLQIIQSKQEKAPPLKIGRFYKIETIQGIDILFESSNSPEKIYAANEVDSKTKQLISKDYLTIDGPTALIHGRSVDLVVCKNDNNSFKILSSHFLWQEEMKARKNGRPFHEEDFYPKCD